jgi:hypothetical protein
MNNLGKTKMTQLVLTEINDLQAETLNGGTKSWQNLYLDNVGALQVNGGNGVQNNFYVFNFNINVARGHKK